MIYREQGYLSDSALELIKLVRNFNWDSAGSTALSPAIAGPRLIEYEGRRAGPPRRRRTRAAVEPEGAQPTSGRN